MSDQYELSEWATIPENMAVLPMAKLYATNVSQDGDVWLWVRYPHMTIAIDLDPDSAHDVAASFTRLANEASKIRAALRAAAEADGDAT